MRQSRISQTQVGFRAFRLFDHKEVGISRSIDIPWGWRLNRIILLIVVIVFGVLGAGLTQFLAAGSAEDGVDPDSSVKRFEVLVDLSSQAVRDNFSGLIWEKSPDPVKRTFAQTTAYCARKKVGGTQDWRLPTVEELVSVVDESLPSPHVPISVFEGVQSDNYWTTTVDDEHPTKRLVVDFRVGDIDDDDNKPTHYVWCVRGEMQDSDE